jgi:hypothetical protein
MTTTTTPDLHIVIAAVGGRADRALIGHTAVSAPLAWNEAIALWEKLEDERRAGVWTSGAGVRRPGHVLHYAVRSVADPRFAPLVGKGYTDARSKDGSRSFKGDEGIVKAAKAWAKAFGYEGRAGGWIYDAAGDSVEQGWRSFADTLRRRGAIAKGADGLWYVLDRPLVP